MQISAYRIYVEPSTEHIPCQGEDEAIPIDNSKTDWGLTHDQVHCVEPDWSRFDSYHVPLVASFRPFKWLF